MSIIVSSCGRFHAVHLATALANQNLLTQFFYAGIPADRSLFQSQKLSFQALISFCDRAYVKFKLEKILPLSPWYTARDRAFDLWVNKKTNNYLCQAKAFVGWANCSLTTMQGLKNKLPLVLECGSMHINDTKRILETEFEKHGQSFYLMEKNRQTILQEYELADFIFVPSEHVKNSFINNGVPEKKIIKVPYGANTEVFFDEKTKTLENEINFIFTGCLSLQKGLFYLLKAWEAIPAKIKSVANLILVGQPTKDFDIMKKSFKNLDKVFFLGPKKQVEIKKIYEKCHVFIMPSLQEGLAMVIGEAMASGLAIICSDRSGGYELINDETGFIVEAGNTDTLNEKILWCIRNPKKVIKMGEVAKKIAQSYTWKEYGTKVINKYGELFGLSIPSSPGL